MNNKKLLSLVALSAMIFVGCGPKNPPVNHQNPLNRNVPEGAVTRTFKENFDLMVDDFSGNTLAGNMTGSAVEENSGFLRVLVDSENDDFPSSPDAAIYKMAAGSFDSAKPDAVGFKMRLVGEGTFSVSNLVLGLRGNDNLDVYPISLKDALNEDGEALPELTSEWQDIVVDFGNTIEDDNTVYTVNGEPSEVKVLETMIGFHLYHDAEVEVSQMIEVKEVFTIKGGTRTTVDAFQHEKTNKNTDFDCYWCDSTGTIVQKGVHIGNGAYEAILPEGASEYENVVIRMMGDNSTLKVAEKAPFAPSIDGAAAEPIKAAVNGAYIDYVVNFEASQIDISASSLLKISSEKPLEVAQIFLTNLQEKAVATEYPVIDIANRAIFDSFNRTQASFTDNWDAASTADYTPDEINVALSYANGNMVSVHDGSLHVTVPDGGYTNVKEANSVAEGSYQYLVIVAKGSIEGFRLGSAAANVIWSHDWLAAPGLKSVPTDLENYPYVTDGFVHYIIDLKESGSDIGADAFIDMYFNNDVEIDSIYFANQALGYETTDTATLGANADLSGYGYIGWLYFGDACELDLTFEGTGDLTSFRFECAAGELSFKNGQIIGLDGQPISKDLTFSEGEPLTVKIDLEASNMGESCHVHSGGWDGSTGSVTVKWSKVIVKTVREQAVSLNSAAGDTGYAYLGSYCQRDFGATTLAVTFQADKEGMTLETFRIEGGEVKFANAGALIDVEGNVIAASTAVPVEESLTIVIDLVATFGELDSFKDDGYMHFHFGGWGTSDANVTMSAVAMAPFTAAYEIAQY